MTRQEREAFVADPHIAVVSVVDGDRGPLTAPVWYDYKPGGEIRFVTGKDSLKARLMQEAGRIGFCVQTETPPYQYVSIEGPVRMEAARLDDDLRPMAVRYLGDDGGTRYVQGRTAEDVAASSVVVVMTPETWRTVDYNKR